MKTNNTNNTNNINNTNNPYTNQTMGTAQFLETTYKLMQRKMHRIIEIEKRNKKKELPLVLLKEKLELTSHILNAITELISILDFNNPDFEGIADCLNDIGICLSKGNIQKTQQLSLRYYDIALAILDGFLYTPYTPEESKIKNT